MNAMLEMCQSGLYDTDKFYEGSFNHPKTQDKGVEPASYGPKRHTYIDYVYGEIFERLRYSATNILEIGAFTGGSHLLWRDYFPNANIIGMDIDDCPALHNQERITFIRQDAYTQQSLDMYPDKHFDIIIDDGPHTYNTMEYFVKNYLAKLKDGGIMVVEDIPHESWAHNLGAHIPAELLNRTMIYDLKPKIGRFDDMLLVINLG